MQEIEAAPRFVMQGARAAVADGMLHIREQVEAIERAVDNNPGLAFDLAKTLIESTCKTVLAERGVDFDTRDDLPKLFKAASNQVRFLPVAASAQASARKSLRQTLNGLHTAIQGVCELRNACGFASHGTAEPRPAMESVQALLAAQAADAVVGFLHRAHQQELAVASTTRFEYGDNEGFNAYVDESHEPVRLFEVEYRPSEVLFRVDGEAYKNYLAEFEEEEHEDG